MTARDGLPVPLELQRSAHSGRERQAWIESGVFAVDLLARVAERTDLAGVDVLDVGCGTKIVKTIIDGDLPVGHYTGVDAYSAVIHWLQANVSDSRFSFEYFDARNDLYNPGGTPLGEFEKLPVADASADLIGLFSVFTHLGPHDYVTMLHLLRRAVRPDGRLVFSAFLNDPDDPPALTKILEERLASADPVVVSEAKAAIERVAAQKDRGFLDEVPEKPLLQARYDLDFALELIDGTGWKVESVNPPEEHIQHYLICRPA